MLTILGCGGAGVRFAEYVTSQLSVRPIFINEHDGDIKVDKKKVMAYATVDKKLINMAFPWIPRISSPYIFVLAGLGGVLGTNIARILGKAKRSQNKLIGLFTLPFSSENRGRIELAREALKDIRKSYDMYFILDNDGLLKHYSHIQIRVAMNIPPEVMKHIILDFRNILIKNMLSVPLRGELGVGVGFGSGKNRLEVAINDALDSPWISDGDMVMLFTGDVDIEDARMAAKPYDPVFLDVYRTPYYGEDVKVTIITQK